MVVSSAADPTGAARSRRGLATELSATATSRAALPGDDIAAAIALLERHGYTVTPPQR